MQCEPLAGLKIYLEVLVPNPFFFKDDISARLATDPDRETVA